MSDLECQQCGAVATFAEAFITDTENEGCGRKGKCDWEEV